MKLALSVSTSPEYVNILASSIALSISAITETDSGL